VKINKKSLFILGKIIVLFLAYWYIYNWFKSVDFEQVEFFSGNKLFFLVLVVLLSVANWGIEAKKWQFVVHDIQKISFVEAIKNVLVGIVLGMFTPNRVGEIGGRAVYLKKNNKLKGAIAASLGSLAQMTITVVVGILGFAVLLFFLDSFKMQYVNYLAISLLVIAAFLIFLFFNLDKLVKFLSKIKFTQKILPKLKFLAKYSNEQLIKILLLSFFRYAVFVFQFYLLLLVFDVQIDFFIAIAGIFTVFLLMNILPNIVIADLGIRGSVSMFVLGQFATNIQGILLASFFLWIINILLPAFFGQILIIRTKSNMII